MKSKETTLVFIDEIQAYDHLLTMVKFLMDDGRFTYIASGSQLGIALNTTSSLPDAVNTFIEQHNLIPIRRVQTNIRNLYKRDAAKYEKDSNKKLKIQRIYDMIPSNLENKKKLVVAKDIEDKKGALPNVPILKNASMPAATRASNTIARKLERRFFTFANYNLST